MRKPTQLIATIEKTRATPIVDPVEAADIRVLTGRFRELRKQIQRQVVDAAVEMGQILEEGKEKLRGRFQRWVTEQLGVRRSTAANYVALARLARESPALIERHRELGAAKLYKIARIPAPQRREVLRIPALKEMSDAEFQLATEPHVVRTRKVTGNMRGHGLRMKVRAMVGELSSTTPPKMKDDEMRQDLRQELLDLARLARDLAERLR